MGVFSFIFAMGVFSFIRMAMVVFSFIFAMGVFSFIRMAMGVFSFIRMARLVFCNGRVFLYKDLGNWARAI